MENQIERTWNANWICARLCGSGCGGLNDWNVVFGLGFTMAI